MNGLLMVVAMLLVAAVMWWLARNDGAATVADQKGMFRMRGAPRRDAVTPARPRWPRSVR